MSQPLSILAVHQGGGIGGAPVSLLKLLAALDPAAFTTHAVFAESGAILEYARELGVSASAVRTGGAFFYSAHARLESRSVARFIRTFPSALQMARATLRRYRPDVVHLNTSVLLAWSAAARRERLPIVWVVREVLGPNPRLRAWHAEVIRRRARVIVATSSAVRDCFPADTPVQVVHNAVDLGEFRLDLLDKGGRVRADLGLAASDHVVMIVGSVQRAKGHWLALDALAHLDDPDARLVLVTGGVSLRYATTLRGAVKRILDLPLDNLDALLREARQRGLIERMHVTGFRRNVARILAGGDVVLFPSLEPEGFGRPIIEAMAMARPVVATDIGPSRELLGPDAGCLLPPVATEVASTVGALLRDPERRARMGRAGRARVEACFGLEQQVQEMERIYREAGQVG